MEEQRLSSWRKQRWLRVACLLGILWLLTGVSLITLFILQKNLMALVFSALIFSVVIQLGYWYCRVRILHEHRRQVRAEILARVATSYNPENDKPPSYEEVMKSDPPPPLYYEIIRECFTRTRRISASVPSSPATSLKSATSTKKASTNNKGQSVAPVHRSNTISCSPERNNGCGVITDNQRTCFENYYSSPDKATDATACSPISDDKNVTTHSERNTERNQARSSISRGRIALPGAKFDILDPLCTIRSPITKNTRLPLCTETIQREVN